MKKGLNLLAACQKQIKLTDRDGELASDEDDTKKIEKAKKAVAARC